MNKAPLRSISRLFSRALLPTAALSALFALAGCAGIRVQETRVATGSVHPAAIYIRPFPVTGEFDGRHGNTGERPIRESIAPSAFAEALQESLSKMAPSRVLADDEIPQVGWVVEGELEVVHAGSPWWRFLIGPSRVGSSRLVANIRVYDLSKHGPPDAKLGSHSRRKGRLAYDFTVNGGSSFYGAGGKVYMPGLGYAAPFDFRNAAERVYMVLSTDPHRYGLNTTPTIR